MKSNIIQSQEFFNSYLPENKQTIIDFINNNWIRHKIQNVCVLTMFDSDGFVNEYSQNRFNLLITTEDIAIDMYNSHIVISHYSTNSTTTIQFPINEESIFQYYLQPNVVFNITNEIFYMIESIAYLLDK